jgi:PAS domain S-box-containing protein
MSPELLNKTRIRVLLVEDSEDDAFLLQRHLARVGFEATVHRVETVEGMRAALTWPDAAWDIILADYNLPSFSAPEALRLVHSLDLDIPFIVLSGIISEETAVTAMRAGANDYVSKQNLARLGPAIQRELREAIQRRERRAAETALRISERRFHRLVEAMPLALLIADASGQVSYCNASVEKLLGYSEQELRSGAITVDHIFPRTTEMTVHLLQMIASGPENTIEIECIRKDGAHVPILLGAALLNPESPAGEQQMAAFLADLTEQKHSHEIMKQTEKLAAAGRLAASIAHEINNPLEAVTNCLYLLQRTQLEEHAREYITLAQNELERVVHITTQTLRFYRQSTRPVEIDLEELFETVLALYEIRMRAHHIDVTRDFRATRFIVGNDGEIRQVLANLVSNAIDAMMQQEAGRLLLRTAETCHWATGREGIAITVADNGSGMDPVVARRIFEPFYSTKGITGTGLGLWVSREIVNKHHGVIQIRSRTSPPSGTVFRLFLPFDSGLQNSFSTGNSAYPAFS